MKLSTIYSAIFAALAIGVSAGPVPNAASLEVIDSGFAHSLDTRAPPKGPVTTSRYKDAVAAAAKVGKKLVPGKFYVFTIEWDLPSSVEGTFESKTELEKLQQKLGFEHVAVVAGEVIAKDRGRDKNKVTDLDFDAQFMDLVKDDDKVTSVLRGPRKMEYMKKGQTLVWAKESTKAKAAKANMEKAGKAFFDSPAHKKYNVDSNNCASFKNAMLLQL
ncbi:hypothetical protein SLS61_003733 [Didymella pomorum]